MGCLAGQLICQMLHGAELLGGVVCSGAALRQTTNSCWVQRSVLVVLEGCVPSICKWPQGV